MSLFYWSVALFLLVNVVAGLVRVARGPTPADRMLAALLFGTTGVAILLVLAEAQASSAFRDAGLILALVAPVTAVAFALQLPERRE